MIRKVFLLKRMGYSTAMDRRETVSFYSQGCRLNHSETATIEQTFISAGFQVVEFGQPADVVVVNTCTVTERGDADTRRLVHKVNRQTPHADIALIGCLAQIQKDKLFELKNVKWVIGNNEKVHLVDHLLNPTGDSVTQVKKINASPFRVPITGKDPHHVRANLKIQDGCDFYCSFCIIPFARGPARSRVFDDILLEAQAYVENGHQEVVLTGVNIGTYEYDGHTFLDIIDGLSAIEGLQRIRISSIEPTTIPYELFDRMASSHMLCNYLHLPLQSGSDPILKAMSRKYTVTEYKTFLDRVLSKVPSLGLGTDVIVGFPGETDDLFDETYHFLNENPFSYFHVFSYSERSLARSKKMPHKVSDHLIHKRSKQLRELSKLKRQAFHQSKLGQIEYVLIEHYKNGYWWGHTTDFAKVAIESSDDLTNVIKPVTFIAHGSDYVLGAIIQ